jgi:hypothetical protein
VFAWWAVGFRSYGDTAISYILKEKNVTPDVTQRIKIMAKQPWNFEWVFGLVSDNLPIFKMHCKPYLLFSCLLGLIGNIALTSDVLSPHPLYVGAFQLLINIGAVMIGCNIDALMIKLARNGKDGVGGVLSLGVICASIGGMMSNIIGGYVVEHLEDKRQFFIGLTFIPIIMFLLTARLSEPKSDFKPCISALGNQMKILVRTLFAPPFLVIRVYSWIILGNLLTFQLGESMLLFRVSNTTLFIQLVF